MLEIVTFMVGFVSGMYVLTQIDEDIKYRIKKNNNKRKIKKRPTYPKDGDKWGTYN
jgi:allophanate hydrolase subunit 1